MIKLQIVNVKDYEYNLKDENGNNYIINLEFFDIDEEPKLGDYIFLNKKLLDSTYEGYSTSYTFGNLENKYGRKNVSIDDIDVIKLIINNSEIYLKRLFG